MFFFSLVPQRSQRVGSNPDYSTIVKQCPQRNLNANAQTSFVAHFYTFLLCGRKSMDFNDRQSQSCFIQTTIASKIGFSWLQLLSVH